MGLSDLETREKSVHSQNGEDGVIEALFNILGETNRYFVEFGVEGGTQCNTAALLERGWQGLMMDLHGICNNPRATVHKEFVTAENINYLLHKYDVPAEFDLLSIDIDGNDFWVWRAIQSRPRVVVIEYNATPGPSECLAIEYDPNFQFEGTDYFGASLLAMQKLGRLKGYTLVYCERHGVNAFFVADDALPLRYQPRRIEEIYRPPNYFGKGCRWGPDPTRRMVDPFASDRGYFRTDVGLTA